MKSEKTASRLKYGKSQEVLAGEQGKIICRGWCRSSDHTASSDLWIVSILDSRFMGNDMVAVRLHTIATDQMSIPA